MIDVGVFKIVDSIEFSQIDSLINSPLIKTRGVLYLARALQEIGEAEKSMKLLIAHGMDEQNINLPISSPYRATPGL